MAADPTPLAPAITSTHCPISTRTRLVSMCMAVLPASVSAAEVEKSTPAGKRTSTRAGTDYDLVGIGWQVRW
jgi:hypothetical protein